jgi:hypothetical protein
MERTPPRGHGDADLTPATTPRGGPFRYRLVDLAGSHVGALEHERALRADEVVVMPDERGEKTWRVVGVLGTCATVVPAAAPR